MSDKSQRIRNILAAFQIRTEKWITWMSENYIEVLGALTGLIYLYFSIRQIIWLWLLGIMTSLLYIYVFYHARFYADMSLQVYYFFISIYGWYHWTHGSGKKNGDEQIARDRHRIQDVGRVNPCQPDPHGNFRLCSGQLHRFPPALPRCFYDSLQYCGDLDAGPEDD